MKYLSTGILINSLVLCSAATFAAPYHYTFSGNIQYIELDGAYLTYIDIDGDGDKSESMKEAAKDKKGSPATRKQGYNDRLDESLAKDGKESSKKQSMKDRRDESKGMEKFMGKGAYSSDPKMS